MPNLAVLGKAHADEVLVGHHHAVERAHFEPHGDLAPGVVGDFGPGAGQHLLREAAALQVHALDRRGAGHLLGGGEAAAHPPPGDDPQSVRRRHGLQLVVHRRSFQRARGGEVGDQARQQREGELGHFLHAEHQRQHREVELAGLQRVELLVAGQPQAELRKDLGLDLRRAQRQFLGEDARRAAACIAGFMELMRDPQLLGGSRRGAGYGQSDQDCSKHRQRTLRWRSRRPRACPPIEACPSTAMGRPAGKPLPQQAVHPQFDPPFRTGKRSHAQRATSYV